MTGVDKALLRHLLLIEGPWEIADYQLDARRRRCDVWVTPQVERGWFGRPKSAPVATQQHVWQHIALGHLRFYVHVSLPVGTAVQPVSWMGTIGQPFTNALAQQVFAFFNEGLSLQSICSVLKLSLNDVWRYRFALDNGRAAVAQTEPGGLSEPSPMSTSSAAAPAGARPAAGNALARPGTAAAAAAASAAAAPVRPAAPPTAPSTAASLSAALAEEGQRHGNIPDVTDPVWLSLITGELQLDIKVLSLKLMLTRVRSQLDLITDDEVRLLKLRDLHRYFVKNERVLSHELAQLRGA